MKNPWVKRNPLLSMWLSSANAIAGTARGKANAAARREAAAMMRRTTKQIADAWSDALVPPNTRARKKKRR